MGKQEKRRYFDGYVADAESVTPTDDLRAIRAPASQGHRLNGFLGRSLNDGTILFLVILLDETVSVR